VLPTEHGERPNLQGLALKRLLAGAAAGAAALVLALLAGASGSVAVLAGWDVLAVVFLVWVWATIRPKDPRETARLALAEDDSRAAADAVLLGASVVSLVAVGLTLAQASKASGADAVLLAAAALLSIALGWAAIHTTFTLMYARMYYTPPIGGVNFEGDDKPDYGDFAYMAFTVGMTYQVSDTDIGRKEIRRTVVKHALLSFVFGTAIIAVAINVVANLVNR
jgi:uncharacterized membrane protein